MAKQKGSLIAASLVIILTGCFKYDPPECEQWEVVDKETSMGGCIWDWSCGGSRTMVLDFCGTSLQEAKAGNTIIISEDACCKRTRTFNRRM